MIGNLKDLVLGIVTSVYELILNFYKFIPHNSKIHIKGFIYRCKFNFIGGGNSCLVVGKKAHMNKCDMLLGKSTNIQIGDSSQLMNVKFHINAVHSTIRIGKNCILQDLEIWIEDNDNIVTIGDGTYIGGAHLAVTGNNKCVTIGESCLLSSGIIMRTGDSHAIVDLYSMEKLNDEKDVIIEPHVWIGQNVTILKGVNIGHDSVIGSSSVVTKNIPNNCIAVGNPSRVVREGVTWTPDRWLTNE